MNEIMINLARLTPLIIICLIVYVLSKLGQRKHRKATSIMQVPEQIKEQKDD